MLYKKQKCSTRNKIFTGVLPCSHDIKSDFYDLSFRRQVNRLYGGKATMQCAWPYVVSAMQPCLGMHAVLVKVSFVMRYVSHYFYPPSK